MDNSSKNPSGGQTGFCHHGNVEGVGIQQKRLHEAEKRAASCHGADSDCVLVRQHIIFVEAMLALRTKRKWDEHNADKHPVVTLSTMHSAKGQEYDHVIIIDAVEDLMPGDPSKPLPFWHASWQDHVEEERRLFYVAATRARHDLRIVVNGLNSSSPKAPSPFIHEMLRDNPNIPVEKLAADDALEEQIEEAMGIPYFAVRRGKTPGIHREYEKAGVEGYSCPVYRRCTTWRKANRFLNKAVSCPVPETETAPDLPLPVERHCCGCFCTAAQRAGCKQVEKIRQKQATCSPKRRLRRKQWTMLPVRQSMH